MKQPKRPRGRPTKPEQMIRCKTSLPEYLVTYLTAFARRHGESFAWALREGARLLYEKEKRRVKQ